MKTLTQIITSIKERISNRETLKRVRRRARLDRMAECAIGVREYKRDLWLSYKDIPLIRVKDVGDGSDFKLYSTLEDARDNYIRVVLNNETDF